MSIQCITLTKGTGLDFKLSSDTCEPHASGAALNYWVTSYKDGFVLEANSIYDEVYTGKFTNEADLIAKIIELENDYRYQ